MKPDNAVETNGSALEYERNFKKSFRESYRLLRDLFDKSRTENPDLRPEDALASADQAVKDRIEREYLHRLTDRLEVNPHIQQLPDHFLNSTKSYAKNHLTHYFDKLYPAWINELQSHYGKTFKDAPNPRSLSWGTNRVLDHLAFRCAAHRVRNNYAIFLRRLSHPKSQPTDDQIRAANRDVPDMNVTSAGDDSLAGLTAKQVTILLYCLLSEAEWDVSGVSASKMRSFLASVTKHSPTTFKPHVEWFHTVATRYEVPEETQRCIALREDISKIRMALKSIGQDLPTELARFDSSLEDQIADKKADKSIKK